MPLFNILYYIEDRYYNISIPPSNACALASVPLKHPGCLSYTYYTLYKPQLPLQRSDSVPASTQQHPALDSP